MLSVFIHSPNNYDTDSVSLETGLTCVEPSLTKQAFAEEADINVIVQRFGITGVLPENPLPPNYGDFTGVSDYHSAMNAVAQAHEAFDALPATLRAKFENDPGQLLAFLDDASNHDEAVSLGLVSKPEAPSGEDFGALPKSSSEGASSPQAPG